LSRPSGRLGVSVTRHKGGPRDDRLADARVDDRLAHARVRRRSPLGWRARPPAVGSRGQRHPASAAEVLVGRVQGLIVYFQTRGHNLPKLA
jgi:hypothetical protein